MDDKTGKPTDKPGIDARIAALSPEKRALLTRQLATRGSLALQRPLARAARRKDAIELSFAQQRLWLLDRILPGGSVYNAGFAAHLIGVLDIDALRGALNEVTRRHEVLRARFALVDGSPVQVIAPELTFELAMEDLSALPEGERQTVGDRRAREEAQAPFDLERGPLLRVRLLRLGEQAHWLLLTLHHIVTDGWSSGVLARELSVLYGAYCRGEPSPLPELPVQYADYAVWQREWLQGAVLDEQLGYWKRALAEMPALELPADRPRPAVTSYRGGRVALELGDELTRALKELGRREGATLFMTLLAAFQVLLYRYSGQTDVAVGVPIAGRTRPELEGLIGFFVNTLVLRGDLSGAPSFREHLGQVRERALEAYAHQDLPFEKLVEELAPKRDLSRNPLVQVCINLVNIPGANLQLDGLTVEPRPENHTSVKFDLTLRVEEVPGRLHAFFEYSMDLFDHSTIERLAGNLRVLLDGIVADPEKAISLLPLLTQVQRHQVLSEWNATAVDYPRNACIHTLFEAQVARTPEAVATVFMAQQLTYRELNARANQLAHHLRGLGVGPDARVAVAMERSSELVVALLGILKAGGAYVPLDPSHPAQRLAFMLEDTQATVLLTQQRLLGQMPPHSCRTLCLDADWATIATQPNTNPVCTATAADLAYVMYTSGSTGLPKGVMVEHRGVCNHLVGLAAPYRLDATDCILQTSAISFDQSVWQIFVPLMVGSRLVLPEPGAHRSPEAIVDHIRRHDVTILRTVPALLAAIVNGPGFSHCERLRRVFCGGESLDNELAARFSSQSDAQLIQTYGPTETTVHSIYFPYRRDGGRQTIPIGRPIANTRVYVLDAHGEEPVPIGVPGELFIGGDGVARGYLGQPELTAERFVPDPFAQRPGARMYRSGDRVRYRPDGNIEFPGRLDYQLKLRGFRIEPGEIEAALARHAEVREAVVVLREDVPGDPRLVAYVVARGEAIAAADLRAWLAPLLPDYMLPSAFVLLATLPLTPNDKIDRKALPAPEYGNSEVEYRAPRTPMEKAIADIWTEVLNLPRVGLNDNFFELGGHSLLAVRLMNRIRHDLNIELSLRQLFETPTVSGLALAAADNPAAGATDRLLSPRA